MATINDLNRSISELSEQEALEMILALRLSRRTPKKKTLVVKAAKPLLKKFQKTPEQVLAKLTPAQAKELLKFLGG